MNILKYIRKYIGYLIIPLVLIPCFSVFAVSLSDIDDYFNINGRFNDLLWQTNQISTNQEHMQRILNDMYEILTDDGYSISNNGTSLENAGLVTIDSNGDLILSVALRNALSEAVQNEIDNNMGFIYAYSYSGADWLDRFQDQSMYRSFLDVLSANENKLIISYTQAYNYPTEIYVYDMRDINFVLDQYNTSQSYYFCDIYDNWEAPTYESYEKAYQLSNGAYVEFTPDSNTRIVDEVFFKRSPQGIITSVATGVRATNLNINKFIVYKSFSSMQAGSSGVKDYYTGNDFSTTTVNNTSTVTQTQLDNSISYQNIVDYTNNYYVTNNNYPTTNNVNNYINNYSGGGGNGGSDDDDDNNNIWDFLDSIGEFLGHLISALGDTLSGILSLLTDVIDLFIGQDGLPNIIGQLINYFLPFLPDWIPTLIGLFVVLSLIIGIVKLIRGH